MRVHANGATAFERTPNFCMSSAIDFDSADDAQLGGGVVRLPEVADQPGGRGHVHVRAAALLLEVRRRGAADVEAALQVHREHLVELGLAHAVEHHVAQDAGVVDDDVDAAEGVRPPLRPSWRAAFQSATEPPSTIASPPAALIFATTSWAGCWLSGVPSSAAPRSLTTTLAPASASASAMPRPDAAPAAGDQGHLACQNLVQCSLLGCDAARRGRLRVNPGSPAQDQLAGISCTSVPCVT